MQARSVISTVATSEHGYAVWPTVYFSDCTWETRNSQGLVRSGVWDFKRMDDEGSARPSAD